MYEWCLKGVCMAQQSKIVFALSMLLSSNKILKRKRKKAD